VIGGPLPFIQTNSKQRIGYDTFFDVFYYLGTFADPFSRAHYAKLSFRERNFAESLWGLLQAHQNEISDADDN
jgi:hypothetical protein